MENYDLSSYEASVEDALNTKLDVTQIDLEGWHNSIEAEDSEDTSNTDN